MLLVLWWAISAGGAVGEALLPSPAAVVRAAIDLPVRGQLLEAAAETTYRVLLGFAVGASLGVVVLAAPGSSLRARRAVARVARATSAVPFVAWVPLIAVFGGVDAFVQVALVAAGALLAVLSVRAGVDIALRRAMAQCWVVVVAAELLSASSGLGALLLESGGMGRGDRVVAVTLVIGVLAALSDIALVVLSRSLRRVTVLPAELER